MRLATAVAIALAVWGLFTGAGFAVKIISDLRTAKAVGEGVVYGRLFAAWVQGFLLGAILGVIDHLKT